MLALVVFQVLAAGGMAVIGWWLCFDDDRPHSGAALRPKQNLLVHLRRRSAA